MIYKVPFAEMTKALYAALTPDTSTTPETARVSIPWFDSAVPISEVEESFRGQVEFSYGIFGASDADCVSNKDYAVWDMALNVEIYSNYKGRKVVAEKLEELVNYLCSELAQQRIQQSLVPHFYLISVTFGRIRINQPIYGDTGVWQSGGMTLTFKVGQTN